MGEEADWIIDQMVDRALSFDPCSDGTMQMKYQARRMLANERKKARQIAEKAIMEVEHERKRRMTKPYNDSLLMPLLDDSIKCAHVLFQDGTQMYTYKTDILDLKEDDLVVVEARGWQKIVTFIEYVDMPPIDDTLNYRWIVGRVPMADHRERTDIENALIQRINQQRAESVRTQMLKAIGIDDPNAVMRLAHEDVFEDAEVVEVDDTSSD